MEIENCLASFGLDGSCKKNGELLIDKAKTLHRRIEKQFDSTIYKNSKVVFAVDIACRLLDIPLDRKKHANLSSADYKKTLNILKTGLNVNWQTVSLESFAVRYNIKFANELRYLLTKYNESLPVKVVDITNDSGYLCACAAALIQLKKEFPISKEREVLFNLSEVKSSLLSSMITTFCNFIPSVPSYESSSSRHEAKKSVEEDEDMSSAAFLSSYLSRTTKSNESQPSHSKGQATIKSSSSGVSSSRTTNSSNSSNGSNAVSAATTTGPSAANAPTAAPENRHLKALGIDLQGELRKIAEVDRMVQESASRKRKAYEVWRDALLLTADTTTRSCNMDGVDTTVC